MKGGKIFCFKCAVENRFDVIAQKLLWNTKDLNCRCDKCKRKIEDVS